MPSSLEQHSEAPAPLRPATIVPALTALAGLTATIAIFFPGSLSNDSLTLYKMLHGAMWKDSSPMVMRHLWWLTDHAICGPGGLFLLHAAAYWLGVALIGCALAQGVALRSSAIAVLGFFPPSFGLLAMLWPDTGMMAALFLALGLILWIPQRRGSPSTALAILAALLLFYGGTVRHNAIVAVVPSAWLLVRALEVRSRSGRQAPLRRAAQAAALVFLFAIGGQGINGYGTTPVNVWAGTAAWDLSAISLAEDRFLIPEAVIVDADKGDPMKRLEDRFWPRNNARLFFGPDRLVTYMLTDDEAALIGAAWRNAVGRYPRSYLAHRAGVSKQIFGIGDGRGDAATPRVPGKPLPPEYCSGNASTELAANPVSTQIADTLSGLRSTALYRPWVYVLVSLVVVGASVRLHGLLAVAARTTALSGILYVAPLVAIAPSAEFRYCLWLVCATVASVLLLIAAASGRDSATTRAI